MLDYRDITVIDFCQANNDGISILRPESLVIAFSDKRMNADIGAYCYKNFGKQKTTKKGGHFGCKLDLSSFVPSRVEKIKLLGEWLFDLYKLGRSSSTVHGYTKAIGLYVKWLNNNNPNIDLFSIESLQLYSWYLIDIKQRGKIKADTAFDRQFFCLSAFGYMEKIPSVDLIYNEGIPRIKGKKKKHSAAATSPVSDHRLNRMVNIYASILDASYEVLINNSSLPYFFDTYEDTWVLNAHTPIIRTQALLESSPRSVQVSLNFADKRLYTFEETKSLIIELGANPHHTSKIRFLLVNAIKKNNAVRYSNVRKEIANNAANAFFGLFVAATGVNYQVAMDIKWGNEYEFQTNVQGYRDLVWKNRKNDYVSVRFETKFKKYVKKYLRIREYILNGSTLENLIVVFGSRDSNRLDPHPYLESSYAGFRVKLSNSTGISDLPSAKELRATRSDQIIRKHNPIVAAELNGNALVTTLRHYSTGSKRRTAISLSPYYKKLREASYDLVKKVAVPHVNIITKPTNNLDENILVGHCSDLNSPQLNSDFDNIDMPDCSKIHSCLFCSKYRAHANEADIRKLFSFQECIFLLKKHANDLDHFERVWGAFIMRVDQIINEIKIKKTGLDKLIKQVYKSVFEYGELDDYWNAHYLMIRDLTA